MGGVGGLISMHFIFEGEGIKAGSGVQEVGRSFWL